MNRDKASTSIDAQSVATPEAVASFNPSNSRCCKAKRFQLDLRGTAANPWNKSATEVFVDSFLACNQYACKDREKIAKKFRSHIRTLIKQFKKQHSDTSAAAVLEKKQKHSRDQRKQTVGVIIMSFISPGR